MTNENFNEVIAQNPLVNKDVDTVKSAISTYREMAMRFIHRELMGYWRKVSESFTLPANTSTFDLKTEYSDLKEVRFMWTTTGMIDFMPERQYRRDYPNGITDKSTPVVYIPISDGNVLFAPTSSTATTIYISYNYIPDFTDISKIPEDLQDLAVDFVLSYFEPAEGSHFYWKKFMTSLKTAKEQLKLSEEEDIVIEPPEIMETLGSVMGDGLRVT